MERAAIEREMSAAEGLLASSSSAHLAYLGLDGAPRVVPVGVFWTGSEFVVSTAATAPKVKALSARAEVALTVDAGDTPGGAVSLSVRGRASVEIVDGVVPEYLAAARRSMDADAAAMFETNVRRMYDQMARIAIIAGDVQGRPPQSLRRGRASMTSVPGGCPASCRTSPRRAR